MQKKLRFKRKAYGRGRVPATRHGWITTLIYVIIVFVSVTRYEQSSQSVPDTILRLITPIIIGTKLLLYLCYVKGEKPRWQRGGKPLK